MFSSVTDITDFNALRESTGLSDGKVDLYCDLHRKCSSMRAISGPRRGCVVAKPRSVVLRDVVLRVGQGGLVHVRKTGRRTVHAFARGVPTELTTCDVKSRPDSFGVRYNPYLRAEFFDSVSGQAVWNLSLLAVEGKTAWGVR